MSDTTLSPRLRHLLIQEDSLTGKLIMPDGSGHGNDYASPPLSPLSPFHSPPFDQWTSTFKSREGRMLPPPRIRIDRRGSQSIFSLLKGLQLTSSTSSPMSGTMQREQARLLSAPIRSPRSPHSPFHPTPLSAPLPDTALPSDFPHDHRHSVNGPLPPRPDLFRRHCSHPYEYHPASRSAPYVSEMDLLPAFGSRAPISRTTKACNACRSRKVRCDAGGSTAVASDEPSTCSRCREAGISCLYSGAQKKRGPCPGAVRPQFRRRFHRYSITSVEPCLSTPPDETSQQYTSRSSYGFAPPSTPPEPSGWSSVSPRPVSARSPRNQQPSVLSWPQMQPAVEMQDERMDRADAERRMFEEEYSMRSAGMNDEASRFAQGRSLPPLRIAIARRESYNEP